MESYPKKSNHNPSKEKLLYDVNSSNYSLEENEYCPHLFDHFLNPYMNSLFKKITISSPSQNTTSNDNKSKKYDTIYSHNLSLYQNYFKTHIYWSYPECTNLFNSFLLKNLTLDYILYSNPQNLPINTINSDGGCIFTLNFNDSGNIMAASNPRNLEIWDVTKRKVKKIISDHKEITSDVAFLHGGENNSNFLTGSLDKTIKLYKNFQNIYTFHEHNDWVRALSISYDNHFFLSGCVSSVVKLWDLNTKIVIGNIINTNESQDFMNTVNSLSFLRTNPNLFMVGLRSGDVKFFDMRINLSNNNIGVILSFKAHNKKLNTAKLNKNDTYILTSGRDSTLRLWDFRKIGESTPILGTKNDYNRNFINEYQKHKCTGYNVECNFYNEEKYLITGSETGSIFIYDILNKNIYKEIKTHLKCINLVKEIPNYSNAFAFSGLAENAVFIYDSVKNINKLYDNEDNSYTDEEKYIIDDDDTKQDKSQELCNNIIEDIMKEYGDAILKTFHKNNVTQNSGINFINLMQMMERNGNESGQNFNQIILNKFTQFFMKMELNNKNTKKDDKNKNKEKSKENNVPKREIKCLECEMKNNNKYKNDDNNIFNCVDKDQLKQLLILPNNFEFNVLNEI